MKVKVSEGAARHYMTRCYQHAPPQCGMLHRPEWVKILEVVEGKWLEVEIEHLFRDQFNTAPIPGVSENGLRLMVEDISAIRDDVRQGVIKCQWCYGYSSPNFPVCLSCGKTEHLRPLNPISPIERGEK